jgi:hypothetical protein
MSTSHAEMYGRRAKRARTVEEVGDNVKRANHGGAGALVVHDVAAAPTQ